MGFLSNKRALIVGVASQRSIATSIAKVMHKEGAELAFSYQGEKLKSRVEDVANEVSSKLVFECDVSSDDSINSMFEQLKQSWPKFDILIHSVGFAPADQLKGNYIDDVNREGFAIAHDISSYSFAALGKAALPMMEGTQGAMLTLSYLGAERAFPNYNVMGVAKASLEANVRYMAYALGERGIRVNAVSAGPVKTLAAAGIGSFRKMLSYNAQNAPLKRNITAEEVANVSAFLCSDLSSGVTGEIVYVDAGFHIMGMNVEGF